MNLSFDYTPSANVRGFYLDISKGLDKRLYCLQFMIKTIVEMNYIIIFKKQNDWAFQWKMSFNPDPNK